MKAVELPLLRVSGTVKENPHMRAFWGATCSFFIAFVGWFALAPVALDVMHTIGTCENQLYAVEEHPTRPAFIAYDNINTGKAYCVHGKLEDESDCKDIPAEAEIAVCEGLFAVPNEVNARELHQIAQSGADEEAEEADDEDDEDC
jgi:hypothetical protein